MPCLWHRRANWTPGLGVWLMAMALACVGGARAEGLGLVRPTEIEASAGLSAAALSYHGGLAGTPFSLGSVEGRLVVHGFAVEAELVGQVPAVASGAGPSVTATARVGFVAPRFAVTAGVGLAWAPRPAPVQPLPSISAAVRLGPVVVYAGLFDRLATAPARLGVAWHDVGAAWVAPIGGELWGRLWLTERWGLEARVVGVALAQALTVAGTLGVVFRAEAWP